MRTLKYCKSFSNKSIWVLFGASMLFMSTGTRNCLNAQDKYANIGVKQYNTREHLLEEKAPLPLEKLFLPTGHEPSAVFRETEKMDTDAELEQELERMREKYKPFTRKLAPDVPRHRKKWPLETFQWRVAGDNPANFHNVLEGKGQWKEVNIPHYAPPVGRATTYYYKAIDITEDMLSDGALYLCFKGVDYKAEVYLNGIFVGQHEGFFAPFEFDISGLAKKGENKLLVKVENDITTTGGENDKGQKVIGDKIYAATGPGYDEPTKGWHHCPAAMGIYQDCYIESRAKIHVNDLFVRPRLQDSIAEAWIEINNRLPYNEKIKLNISMYGQNFKKVIHDDLEYIPKTTIVPGIGDLDKPTDNQSVHLPMMGGYVNYLKLTLPVPEFRLWSPQAPWLYELQVKVIDKNGELLDVQRQEFGMRSFSMDTANIPRGRLYLNGKPIRLRGANTQGHLQNCAINKDWDQLRDDILLAKIANMNYLRITQRPVQDEIYSYCDMLGLMNQADLPLFGTLSRNQFSELVKQAGEMERLVRSHPSTIMVTYINERFPNGEGFPQRSFSTPIEYKKVFDALNQAVHLQNPDRIIKPVDGDYDPPAQGLPDNHCYNMWYNGHGLEVGKMHKGYWQPVKPGWYYGCGEFGAEGLDRVGVMKKYYPDEWLPKNKEEEKQWTPNQISMCQTGRFHYMWFNTQYSLQEWSEESQEYQAMALKTMAEAFRRDSRMVSFAVHLFIDAWPGGWMKAIMDVDRQPKKAYFAYRDALKPLMVNLRSDRDKYFITDTIKAEAWICNDLIEAPEGCQLHYQFEQDGQIVFANKTKALIPSCSSKFNGFLQFAAPDVEKRTSCSLRLSLFDEKGEVMDQAELPIEVFPETEEIHQNIYVPVNQSGKAYSLARDAGGNMTSDINQAEIILFDKFADYKQDSARINQLVKKGAKLIFLQLPEGKYVINQDEVNISNTTMGEYYFVSPESGHELTRPFQPYDFRFWYDESKGYIAPILSAYFKGEGWEPVLSSGSTGWTSKSEKMIAVGKKSHGKGAFYLSQIDLSGRVNENPTAKIFFINLLTK